MERVQIDVVHEHNSHHCCQSIEAPPAIQTLLLQCHEQISNQGGPNLYLDSIAALAVEVSEREILLDLLE